MEAQTIIRQPKTTYPVLSNYRVRWFIGRDMEQGTVQEAYKVDGILLLRITTDKGKTITLPACRMAQ